MGLDSGKHTEKEINEVRCRIIETGISLERVDFLKELLEVNGFEVLTSELPAKEEGAAPTYMLGVTDLTFNPVLAVYEHKLKTKNGHLVTPAYWNQLTEENKLDYWNFGHNG